MVKGENPTPGSGSCCCHLALTPLFLHTHDPGHTGQVSSQLQGENRVPQPCPSRGKPTPASALAPRFPTGKTCPSTPSTNLSICWPIHQLAHPPMYSFSHPPATHLPSSPHPVIHPPIQRLVHLPVRLSIHLPPTHPSPDSPLHPSTSTHAQTHSPIHPSVHAHLSTHICPPVHQSAHPSIPLSTHPPTHSFFLSFSRPFPESKDTKQLGHSPSPWAPGPKRTDWRT